MLIGKASQRQSSLKFLLSSADTKSMETSLEDLWSSFASLTYDGPRGVWVLADDEGDELAAADDLQAAIRLIARSGGGTVSF